MKEGTENEDEATGSQRKEQDIEDAFNQCSCKIRQDLSFVQIYKH